MNPNEGDVIIGSVAPLKGGRSSSFTSIFAICSIKKEMGTKFFAASVGFPQHAALAGSFP